MTIRFLSVALLLATSPVLADAPTIERVTASSEGATWRFDVTVSHGDTGWDHYADGWRVLDMDGNQLALRELHHPHVDEQPFTRSIGGVRLPEGARQVRIEARDNVSGWSGNPKTVTLP